MIIFPQINTTETFDASGTFTAKETGVHTIFLCGGGSGGGGGQSGGSGSYGYVGSYGPGGVAGAMLVITQSLTKDSTYTVTVGAAGTSGSGGSGNYIAGGAGGDGGDTVFDATTVIGGTALTPVSGDVAVPSESCRPYGTGGGDGVAGAWNGTDLGTAGSAAVGLGAGGGGGGGGSGGTSGSYAGGAGAIGGAGICVILWSK